MKKLTWKHIENFSSDFDLTRIDASQAVSAKELIIAFEIIKFYFDTNIATLLLDTLKNHKFKVKIQIIIRQLSDILYKLQEKAGFGLLLRKTKEKILNHSQISIQLHEFESIHTEIYIFYICSKVNFVKEQRKKGYDFDLKTTLGNV